MSPIDHGVVLHKLEYARKSIEDIEVLLAKGETVYLGSAIDQTLMERYIERLVEVIMDGLAHILKQDFKVVPLTYKQMFTDAGKQGVLSSHLAQDAASAAGLRNIIAHQYTEIDHKQLFKSAQTIVLLFPQVMAEIRDYMKKQK